MQLDIHFRLSNSRTDLQQVSRSVTWRWLGMPHCWWVQISEIMHAQKLTKCRLRQFYEHSNLWIIYKVKTKATRRIYLNNNRFFFAVWYSLGVRALFLSYLAHVFKLRLTIRKYSITREPVYVLIVFFIACYHLIPSLYSLDHDMVTVISPLWTIGWSLEPFTNIVLPQYRTEMNLILRLLDCSMAVTSNSDNLVALTSDN